MHPAILAPRKLDVADPEQNVAGGGSCVDNGKPFNCPTGFALYATPCASSFRLLSSVSSKSGARPWDAAAARTILAALNVLDSSTERNGLLSSSQRLTVALQRLA